MIVAVTGGTGFIGRHLIARHVARGDQVRYLTRNRVQKALDGALPFTGHLNSPVAELREFLAGVDVLYHCAAELHNEAEMHDTNVRGTENLLAAADGEVRLWVQLSSTGVYGNPMHKAINEDSAIDPANAYERTKAAADQLVSAAAKNRNLQCAILRPSNVYGADMPNQSLFQLIRIIDKGLFFFIGEPGAVANYVHVENVVDALVLCGTATLPGNGRSYIVSDHCPLEAFAGIITAALEKKPVRLRLPEFFVRAAASLGGMIPGWPLTRSRIDALTSRTVYLTGRIESELGYRPGISMAAGIGELARCWKSRSG